MRTDTQAQDRLASGPRRPFAGTRERATGAGRGVRAVLLVLVLTGAGASCLRCGRAPESAAAREVRAAAGLPDPTERAGPRGGPLFRLGDGDGYLEVRHDENWGTVGLYLYDAGLDEAEFDAPPLLNVWFDDVAVRVEATREDFQGAEDGGWHLEHDSLLGVPERARFCLRAFRRTYVPPFEHVHVVHGKVASGHARPPDVPHPGPHGGTMMVLSDGRGVVEMLHDKDLGTASLYLFDRMLEPAAPDGPVVLNAMMGDEPVQMVAGREDFDGNRDGGWHWEETPLIGPLSGARLRLAYAGRTYVPPFRPHYEDEAPHSHDVR